MAAPAGDSAFAAAAQAPVEAPGKADTRAPVDVEASSSLPSTKSYKLVKSPTGNNLYVEAPEYDPLEHHRKKDKAANKGEGLRFMFPCCFAPQADERETLHGCGYEVDAAPAAAAAANKTD
ncbi:hypothetical protein HT031_006319 [Scenedesmus sp. PABB004]|nr:hypothetical protein HT031_006319 [Scenedesmus sp. PABB004]